MSVLSTSFVTTNFPQYGSYFNDAESSYSEEVLQRELDFAEAQVNTYIALPATEAELTTTVKLFILNVVRYRGFNLLYGDQQFDNKPQIVKDYEDTIAMLKDLKNGSALTGVDITPPAAITAAFVLSGKTARLSSGFDGIPSTTESEQW